MNTTLILTNAGLKMALNKNKMKAKAKSAQATIDDLESEIEQAENPQLFDDMPRQKSSGEALKAINALSVPFQKSSDLIGVEFDIIDAFRGTILNKKTRMNEPTANFIIRTKDGKEMKVGKALNHFNEAYVEYFEARSAELEGTEQKPEPLEGYTFTELSEGGQAGNKPIVLRKL